LLTYNDKFLNFMLYYFFFFSYLFPQINSATGGNFIDYFSNANSSRWIQEDGDLSCVGNDVDGQCILASKENVIYRVIPARKPSERLQKTVVEIWMDNDCVGEKCCDKEMRCTVYTGGHITSAETFAYGSFTFMALMSDVREYRGSGVHAAFSCFNLVAEKEDDPYMVAICIGSHDTHKATLIWMKDDFFKTLLVDLRFNAAKEVAKYQIDWFPGHVEWFVNGISVGSSDEGVPDVPLVMTILHLPQLPHHLMTARTKKEGFSIQMSILRLRYRKFIPSNYVDKASFVDDHVDLFMKNDSSNVSLTIVLIMIILMINIFVVITYFCFWESCVNKRNSDVNGYYTIFED